MVTPVIGVGDVILEAEVEGSGTSVVFTNLTARDGSYYIELDKTYISGSCYIYVNGDTTNTNYWEMHLIGSATSVGNLAENDCAIFDHTRYRFWVSLHNNKIRILQFSGHINSSGGDAAVGINHILYTVSSSDITQIQFSFYYPATFKVKLYKYRSYL